MRESITNLVRRRKQGSIRAGSFSFFKNEEVLRESTALVSGVGEIK